MLTIFNNVTFRLPMNPSTRLKKMQRQGIFREMKLRRNHEPPEKRVRQQVKAGRFRNR
jgi:hypothetical protein